VAKTADPFVFTKKTVLMQRVSDAVRLGHTRYVVGLTTLEKTRALAEKFDRLYQPNLEKTAAHRVRKAGKATTRLFFLNLKGEDVWWILLATDGEFAIGDDREKWRDPIAKGSRVELRGYELLQVTKPGLKNPAWTWRYTRKQHDALREAVILAIRTRHDADLKQLIQTIWRTPGFSGARDQALKFRDLIQDEWKRSRGPAEAIPEIPKRLGYVRRLKDVGKSASNLLRDLKADKSALTGGAPTA
jgi:hypothetical protein